MNAEQTNRRAEGRTIDDSGIENSTRARWSRVTEIVGEALRRPDLKERSRYLKSACGDDRNLRREVDELLTFEDADSGVLDGPLLEGLQHGKNAQPDAPSAITAGRRVGPYRMEGPLGSGGMGVVALAFDTELERQVAIKLLRPEHLTGDLLRRFETERRILARLDHPHIARILGGGTDGDRPYFAMEYVEGQPIDIWCDQRQLPIEGRIHLVLQICDALAEAHRNLVVHRDLKPGNVLVTANGEPKLLDFGIAKELDSGLDKTAINTAATRTGHQPLTPAYASPEQVRGLPVTVATDIYSLGVLLYRLLCGHPPYLLDGDHFENVRKICEEEPPAPSTQTLLIHEEWRQGTPSPITPDQLASARSSTPKALARQLHGDLDGIVTKALAKQPKERYRSMEQLAEDLRRHLAGLPITARRATFLYQIGKLLRRRRLELALTTLALALLIAGTFLWLRSQGQIRAVEQRQRAIAEEAAEAERQAAALTLFARNLVWAIKPDITGERTFSAREILELSRDQARRSLSNQPESLAHQLQALGLAYQSLGDLRAARPFLEESLELRRKVYSGDTGDTDHRLVALGLNNLAALDYMAGDRAGAERLYQEALAMKRRLGLPPEELEKVESNLATLLAFRGEYEEAETLYRNVLERRRANYKAGDLDIATSLRNLGHLLYLKGDLARAETLLREALELRRESRQPGNTAVASVLGSLARVLHAQDRLEEAEALLTETLAIRRRRLGDGHLHVALTEKDLAEVYFDLEEHAVAEVLWLRAQRTIREKKPSGSWELADIESRLGVQLVSGDQVEAARLCLRRSFETLQVLRGERATFTRRARARITALETRYPSSKAPGLE